MKRLFSFLVPLVVVLLLASSLEARAEDRAIKRNTEGRRAALVIGNGAYTSAPLKNPANDATDMAAALKSLGFDVILHTNVDKRSMIDALGVYESKARGAEAGVFFYAGHGMQVDGRNYLIPVKARVERETDVEFEAVDAGRIIGAMETAGARVNVVILDACRDNPFARSFRSASRGLARMDSPAGTFVAYATAPGAVAADGQGRNGLFTQALLKHIKTPGLSINDILMNVRVDVAAITGQKQIPWESSSLMGRFYFAGQGRTRDDGPAPGPAVEAASREPAAPALAAIEPGPRPSPPAAGLEELRRDFVGEWVFYWKVPGGWGQNKKGYIAIEEIKALDEIGFGRADMGKGRCDVTSARFEGNKLIVGLKRTTGRYNFELTLSRGAKGMEGTLSYSYVRQPPEYVSLRFETE